MFEDYLRELQEKPKEVSPVVSLNFQENVVLNHSVLTNVLLNVDTINVEDLYRILTNASEVILSKNYINSNKIAISKAFTNEKFITVFSQVIGSKQEFTTEERIQCNRMVYDYLTMEHEKNAHIQGLLYNLGMTVNRDVVPVLMALGLDQNTAIYLAIARYSTDKEDLAVKRVNVLIVNGGSVMTEQMIVYIYEKLFDHLTPLFEGIMFDKWDSSLFEDEEEIEEIYGLINLALLDILNETTTANIKHVLSQFSQIKQLLRPDAPVRFNIKAISSNYDRILQAIDELEMAGNHIPEV